MTIEMRADQSITKHIDWILVGIYIALVIMGWLNIYAATYNEEHKSIFDISQSYGKQMLWICLAFVIIMTIMLLDIRFFEYFAYFIFGASLLLLVSVLLFGTVIKGNKSWIVIGGGWFSIQPSEFAKYATALALAKFLSSYNTKMENLKTRIIAVMLLAAPAGLIILQPDVGSALVYISFILVLYREGLSGNILLLGLYAAVLFVLAILFQSAEIPITPDFVLSGKNVLIIVLVILAAIVYWVLKRNKRIWVVILVALGLTVGYIQSIDYIFDKVLSQHHRDRINELLGVISDPKGTGYNVNQSKIAIGSGGFAGKGFLQGTQTKYDFVPEQSTDFIFCTVGEEWGFLGSFVVIGLFVFLLIYLVIVAERQRSKFSRIYGYTVACILFFHLTINIGMTIGLSPVIGIPLPFFSYGGSSLWAFTLLFFTFVKLDSERKYILQ